MSLLSSQRIQIRNIVMEVDSLKAELRHDPEEFAAEMKAISEWCLWQAQLLASKKRSAA